MQTTAGGPEDHEAGALALVSRHGPPQKSQKTVLTVSASLVPGDAGAVSAPGTHRATAAVGVPKSQLCTAAAAAPLLEREGMSQQQRALLVLRHGPSDRLQGVAIVAGYEPPVQRSDYGRRDPRFDFGRRDPRFCWTPHRASLALYPSRIQRWLGHAPGDALYSPAHAHIQMQTPWTGTCIPCITSYGALAGFRKCEHRSHSLSRLRLATCATEWISPHSTSSVRGCSTPHFACAPPGCLGMCNLPRASRTRS